MTQRQAGTGRVETALTPVRAHGTGPASQAVQTVVEGLTFGLGGSVATAVLYFASSQYDPADLAGPISSAFPDAAVTGCSTAGEFTDTITGSGGISAVALPYGILTGAVAGLGDLSRDVQEGIWSTVRALEATLRVPLRDLDPTCHLGLLLLDGMHAAEEQVNQILGEAAPLLDIVGGSAGDDLEFDRTWVAVSDRISYQGVALLVCQTGVPFQVVKTCSFAPIGTALRNFDADLDGRTVHSFDGLPAAQAYADAIGESVGALDPSVWGQHPVGLMIDGQPWIRSLKAITSDGGIVFHAQILPGTQVEVLAATDLISDTRRALDRARAALNGYASGAVLFNSVLRRLEVDAGQASEPFLRALGGLPLAGFHTYGESWLGHMNQTLIGVVFG